MKTASIFRNLGISLILIIGISLMSGVTVAATKPLDVILLMDSSGSMKKTDPHFLRKPAAKLFISLLSEDDRVSVVSFSDAGYPVSYLASAKNPRSQKRHFAAVDKISTKGVYTNLSAAIETAMKVYRRNPMPHRQLHVILMTDGKVDVGSAKNNRELRQKLLSTIAPKLAKQGIKLHGIAFTNHSDIDLLQQLAQKTSGNFYLAKTDKELHGVYTAIFENTKTPNQVPFNGEKFVIDNSISEATIIGSKSGNRPLSLRAPNGKRYSSQNAPASVKWMETPQFDLITIKTPQPGEWQLLSSEGHNKAYVITDLQLKTAFEPNHPDVGEGVMIKSWLEEKAHKLNKNEILSNLSVSINVLTPEGQTHRLAMEPYANYDGAKDSDGVFASYIAFPSKGQFQLNIQFDGKTFSRKSQLVVGVGVPAESNTNTTLEKAVADVVNHDTKVSTASHSLQGKIEMPKLDDANIDLSQAASVGDADTTNAGSSSAAHTTLATPADLATPANSASTPNGESHTTATSHAANTASAKVAADTKSASSAEPASYAGAAAAAVTASQAETTTAPAAKTAHADSAASPQAMPQQAEGDSQANAKDKKLASKNKGKTNDKAAHKKPDAKGDKKNAHAKAGDGEPANAETSSPLMTAIFVFVGINLFLALAGSGAYWFMQRKKRAQNGEDDESSVDDGGARDGRKEPQISSKAA